jgi:ATP-binding cassette subfamily B protein
MLRSELADPGVLDQLPLVAALPPAVREIVADSFVPVSFGFGEVVFAAGQEGDGYYVVLEGQARVLIDEGGGSEVSLNLLGPGDAFGEDSLLDGTPRAITVRAASALTVLRLDAGVFKAVVGRYPEVRESFETAARARRLNEFLRVHSAFSVLRASSSMDLLEHLEEVELGDGEVAVRQGDEADAMFLIQEGRLGVWLEQDGESRRIRTLHAGEFFGEFALVLGSARTATVIAEGEVQLLRLAREGFERLMRSSPRFAARIQERIALYEARDRRPTVTPAPETADVWAAEDPGLAVTEHGAEDIAPPPAARRRRRFPFVRQIDQMDCGAACIAMICKSFGHDVSITAIREAVGTGTEGTTLRGLTTGGEQLGLKMRAIKSSADRLEALPLPAIVHWEGNHWIVVYDIDGDRVWVADPGRALRKVERSELAERWSGYAAVCAPAQAPARDRAIARARGRGL